MVSLLGIFPKSMDFLLARQLSENLSKCPHLNSEKLRKNRKKKNVPNTNTKRKNHDVRLDYVGINGRARFTCYTEGCNGATIVRQPYMTFTVWEETTEHFSKKHPCSDIKNEGYRG